MQRTIPEGWLAMSNRFSPVGALWMSAMFP
jgi:hypothetical protein